MALIGAMIGFLAGLAGVGLVRLIALLSNLALLQRIGWTLPSFANLKPSPWTVAVAACGGFVVALIARRVPVIRGHGIPEAMEAVLEQESRIPPSAAVAKPLSAAIAIGTGGPFGAEGPIIVTGGAIGSLIGQVLPVSPSERKVLLAAGAAAGMSAIFGTPLAAVILVTELLLFEFSRRSFIPIVVSSSVAAGVHAWFFGSGPLFPIPPQVSVSPLSLPLFSVLGIVCGVAAIVISRGLFAFEEGYRRLPITSFWHPVIGSIGFALIGLLVPRALGVGYDSIGSVLSGKLALETLVVLAVGKLIAWWIALASGTSGGTLAPLLLIGGSMGGAIGESLAKLFPAWHLSPVGVAAVAMAATFGAATAAPFTAIVFLFELTHDYSLVLPLMMATVIAHLVTRTFMKDSIMTEKLTRRGLRVHHDLEADAMRRTLVRQVMSMPALTLDANVPIRTLRERFAAGGPGAYPLIEPDQGLVGIVTRGDVLGELDGSEPALSVATRDILTVSPSDQVLVAVHRMIDGEVEHLPVVEDGRVVGMFTRTDALKARVRQLQSERAQPGWWRRSAVLKKDGSGGS
jgi:CIC family chloride channel protein